MRTQAPVASKATEAGFGTALTEAAGRLQRRDTRAVTLHSGRWRRRACPGDRQLLTRCRDARST